MTNFLTTTDPLLITITVILFGYLRYLHGGGR